MSERNRIDWLDGAKGYALLAVMLGHLIEGMNLQISRITGVETWPILAILYSFDIPAFFMISGYLFKMPETGFFTYLKRKLKGLILPYFILGIIIVLSYMAINGELSAFFLKKHLLELVVQNRYQTLWYLASAFLALLLFYLLVWATRGRQVVLGIVATAILVLGLAYYRLGGGPLPWNLDTVPVACFFAWVGYLLRQHDFTDRRFVFPFTLVLALAFTFSNMLLGGWYLNMYWCQYSIEPMVIAAAVVGSLALLAFARLWAPAPVRLLGRKSLIFFALHQVVSVELWEIICRNLHLFLKQGMVNFVLYIVLGMVFVLVTMAIAQVIYDMFRGLVARDKQA